MQEKLEMDGIQSLSDLCQCINDGYIFLFVQPSDFQELARILYSYGYVPDWQRMLWYMTGYHLAFSSFQERLFLFRAAYPESYDLLHEQYSRGTTSDFALSQYLGFPEDEIPERRDSAFRELRSIMNSGPNILLTSIFPPETAEKLATIDLHTVSDLMEFFNQNSRLSQFGPKAESDVYRFIRNSKRDTLFTPEMKAAMKAADVSNPELLADEIKRTHEVPGASAEAAIHILHRLLDARLVSADEAFQALEKWW